VTDIFVYFSGHSFKLLQNSQSVSDECMLIIDGGRSKEFC